MDKWDYIQLISDCDTYDKTNLEQITLDETKEFYEKYIAKKY